MVAAEAPAPNAMTEHGDLWARRPIFLRCERTAKKRLHAEHGKEIGRDLVGAETRADRLVRATPPFLLAGHNVR